MAKDKDGKEIVEKPEEFSTELKGTFFDNFEFSSDEKLEDKTVVKTPEQIKS